MTSAENPAPDNSPQSIRELRNGHVANLQELYYTRLVRKWRDIKFWYMCLLCSSLELQCVSLIDDAQTYSIDYGHLVDLQKTLPTIDLNKKNLSFDKISPHDF